jgi:putative peptidoglycan lipid II flippase
MIGVSFPVADQILMIFFKEYVEPGVLTQLNLGNRVMVAPLAMLAQAASVAAFPYLAGDSALGRWDDFAEFLRSGLRRLLFIALPASTLLILLAQPIIIMIFRHGLFTAADAQASAIAFSFYCVGMFAWAGQQFVARGLYALQDTVTPTIIGTTITFVFFVPLCFFVVIYLPFPLIGLAFATSLGACAHFCGVFIALEKKLARPPYSMPLGSERVLGTLLRTFTACLVMGIVGLIVKNLSDNVLPQAILESFAGQLVRIGIITPPALGAFAWAAQRFNIPEWDWLLSKFRRRKSAKAA